MNLTPAHWIWFPSSRTLPNTFVLFRHTLTLTEQPVSAQGWLTADSRYRLTVNGKRFQWGPAPSDPRHLEVDPIDLTAMFRPGDNVIGVEVLFYGLGEGTWVSGKPGLLFSLTLEDPQGRHTSIVSDTTWQCFLDRAHPPGQHKRWFLRTLQEEFDARLHPQGWNTPEFVPDEQWLPAQVLPVAADKPAISGPYRDYHEDSGANSADCELRARTIPLLREQEIPAARLTDAGRVQWRRDPRDWFDMRTPEAFTIIRDPATVHTSDNLSWTWTPTGDQQEALFMTFEWPEQVVGWPYFTIDAPEGTIIEVMHQEAHATTGPAWLDSHFFNWSRFICREGLNTFEAFDYECLRWVQLHIRNASRTLTISKVGIRRRIYDWPHQPHIVCSEPPLQRLFDASINTLYNSAQDICVDGMGRERQQYSGDCGHQLHTVRTLFGETRLPRRFLHTYCLGQTVDGYFLDSWPAYDRLSRIAQRQLQTSPWGPLLDHSVGFVFDTWHHYLETGDLSAILPVYPRLLHFSAYLERIRDEHGLLPVDSLGLPVVWIDHDAYQQQRHKQCAFNLYAAAMFSFALAPLAYAVGDATQASHAEQLGQALLTATQHRFWDPSRSLFVNNLPWLYEDQMMRLCDRSLATAVLYGQFPGGQDKEALRVLADCPPEMGLSYPANACWRYWALARGNRVDIVLQDLRTRWAHMDSVQQNNTLQEMWEVQPDSTHQWSHCPLAPLLSLIMDIAGIRPLTPGFEHYQIRPQLADLPDLALTAHTPHGPVQFNAQRTGEGHQVTIHTPPGGNGLLVVPASCHVALQEAGNDDIDGWRSFHLPENTECAFWLPAQVRQ